VFVEDSYVYGRRPCELWKFGIYLKSHEFGGAGSSGYVPRGGKPTLEASAFELDNHARTAAVLCGYVGAEAVEVEAVAEDGRKFMIRPRLVAAGQRQGRPWLGDFRYFVFFHSAASPIERLSILNAAGETIETDENRTL